MRLAPKWATLGDGKLTRKPKKYTTTKVNLGTVTRHDDDVLRDDKTLCRVFHTACTASASCRGGTHGLVMSLPLQAGP